MKKILFFSILTAVFCGTALAGFTEINVSLSLDTGMLPVPPNAKVPSHIGDIEWGFIIPPDGNADIDLFERLAGKLPEWIKLEVSGETDADPIMNITKTVTNDTQDTWEGYQIALAGEDVSFIAGTASSDVFNNVTEGAMLLDFQSPLSVGPGESVTFDFDILVESVGVYTFELSQTPRLEVIPEPATLGLMALGAIAFIRKRT